MGFLKKQDRYEKQARQWLVKQGLKPLYQNFCGPHGELDLIMLEQIGQAQTLVVVEVKFRQQGHFGKAQEQVILSKQQKIIRTTELFLLRYPRYAKLAIRFDVLAINDQQVEWIQAAFY